MSKRDDVHWDRCRCGKEGVFLRLGNWECVVERVLTFDTTSLAKAGSRVLYNSYT